MTIDDENKIREIVREALKEERLSLHEKMCVAFFDSLAFSDDNPNEVCSVANKLDMLMCLRNAIDFHPSKVKKQ